MKSLTGKEFDRAYKKGLRFRAEKLNFIISRGAEEKKLGIAVSKKHGSAVIRNRIKRRIKEAVRKIEEKLSTGTQIVIIPAIGVDKLTFKELSGEILTALRKARIVS